jgi:hypothetical protein
VSHPLLPAHPTIFLHHRSSFTIHDHHDNSLNSNPQSLLTSGIDTSTMEAATHLLRRGFEATMGDNKDDPIKKMPAWGVLILATTFLIYLGVMFTVRLLDPPS